jgi:hypothetical protein
VVPWASIPIFMLCAPELVFGGTDGVGSLFHVFTLGHVFGGAEGVRRRFYVLCSRARFRLFRGHRVPFSCFALQDSFSAAPRSSGPIFIFCTPGLIFGGIEGVGSRFYILRARTHFRRIRGRRVPFSCFAPWTRFRRFRGLRVLFSSFASLHSFSAVLRASVPVFMFFAPGHIFGYIEGVGSRFNVLRA